MNEYNLAPRIDAAGFEVQIVAADGARQTITGFVTESEAQAWIAQDQRLIRAADPFQVQAGRLGRS